MKKNKLKLIMCVIFCAAISVPLTSYIWGKGINAKNEDLPTFPTWSENYSSDLINYLEKMFPFRGDWIEYYKSINGQWLKSFNEYLYKLSGGKYLIPRSENNVIFGKENWLFYEGNDSVSYYRGTNLLSEAALNEYFNALNGLQNKCKSKGIKILFISCPNKENVYSQYMPSFSVVNQNKRNLRLRDFLINKGVNFLYPIENLSNNNLLTYYVQDTHWNKYGAYIAYKELLSVIEKPVFDCNVAKTQKHGGDLADMCGIKNYYEDYVCEYRPEIKYVIDDNISNNRILYTINSSETNKICLIGDSFRENIQYYFSKDFNENLTLHVDMIRDNFVTNYISSLKENDVLIIESVERLDISLINTCNYLTQII